MSNLTAQYIAVGLAIVIAVAWVIRRVVRKHRCGKGGCGCNTGAADMCEGCDLASHCRTRRK